MASTLKKENIKLKIILYFLIGLIFYVFGIILGGLWIKFKGKTNQKTKYVALLIGFGLHVLFSLIISPYVFKPQSKNALYAKYPETKIIESAVSNTFKDGKTDVGLGWYTHTKNGQKIKTTSSLNIVYTSNTSLSAKQIQRMGKLVCQKLQEINKNYDEVNIVSIHPVVPIINFNTSYEIDATCDEWNHKDFSFYDSPIDE